MGKRLLLYRIKTGKDNAKLNVTPIINFRDFHCMSTGKDFELKQIIDFYENKYNNSLNSTKQIIETLESIKRRDKNDMEKEMGALKIAEDAMVLDSSNLSIEEVVNINLIVFLNYKKR